MSSWTIGRRIVVGFAAVIAIAGILGVFAYTRLIVIETQSARITVDSLPGTYISGQMTTEAESRFALVLKHVLVRRAEQKTAIEKELAAADARMAKLMTEYERTITTTKDRRALRTVQDGRRTDRRDSRAGAQRQPRVQGR